MANDEELVGYLEAVLRDAARHALETVANEIEFEAKEDLPRGDPAVDPNPAESLRDSFHVRWTNSDTLRISVVAPYAIKQHESFYLKHPRGGGPKFLERHFTTAGLRLEAEFQKEVKLSLRGLSSGITHDAQEAKDAFAAIGVHSLADYVQGVKGLRVLPGTGENDPRSKRFGGG